MFLNALRAPGNKYSGIILALGFLFLMAGCTESDYSFEAVEIDFLHVDTLKEGDWIEIDGVRFTHVKAFEDVQEQEFTLPASRITRGGERREGFTEPFPSLNIGYLLASYLYNINKDDGLSADHNHTYKIIDPDLMHALGKVRIMRGDSSKIQIVTSENYPAQIRSIQL
jgi:hypothetical protein